MRGLHESDPMGGVAAPLPPAVVAGGRLSLAEIANLPGAGHAAALVRRWYDQNFAIGPEPDEESVALPRWEVDLEYSEITHERATLMISAPDEETARKLARKEVENGACGDEVEFGWVRARRLDQ